MDIQLMQYATSLPVECSLSHNARCALVWLAASKFDSKAECSPAIGTMAQRAALSYDSISRGIAELERAGIVKRAARAVGGRKVANRYAVTLEETHSGNDTAHSGNDTAHSGNDTAHSGNDTAHSGIQHTAHSGIDTAHSGIKGKSIVNKKVCVPNAHAPARVRARAAACAAAHTHTFNFSDDDLSRLADASGVPLAFVKERVAEWARSGWTTTQGKPIKPESLKAHLVAWWKHEENRERYERPQRRTATPRKFTAKDWLLCAERCAHCTGNGCGKGITTPPDKGAHQCPPEECKEFAAKRRKGKGEK